MDGSVAVPMSIVKAEAENSPSNLVAFTPEQVVAQIQAIQQVMHKVMKPGTHYMTIPGTEKKCPGCNGRKHNEGQTCRECKGEGKLPNPTLTKAGAEKLCLTFALVPRYTVEYTDLPGGHREYRIRCELYTRGSETYCGAGVGVCSTMESKYRWRWDNTGQQVPKKYWDSRDPELLGGPGHIPRKTWDNVGDGRRAQVWMIFRRVEHDNPADYFNTAVKIGKKRAFVDSTITTTSSSDIFAQDLEDLPQNTHEVAPGSTQAAQPAPPAKKPAKAAPAASSQATKAIGDHFAKEKPFLEGTYDDHKAQEQKPIEPTPASVKGVGAAAAEWPPFAEKDLSWPRVEGGIEEKDHKRLWSRIKGKPTAKFPAGACVRAAELAEKAGADPKDAYSEMEYTILCKIAEQGFSRTDHITKDSFQDALDWIDQQAR